MKNIKIINGDDLRIIALKSAEELGNKINLNIQASRNTETNYLVKVETPRFANSEGKAKILETVRGKDVFILTDVGNYSIKYTMFGEENKMSYDDHYQDLKRVINATAATANRIWAVMPLLYSSRQHKREGRESLDCAMALQELEFFGVKGIITFDAHDPGVRSALNKTSFDNIYPTHSLINEFLDSETIDLNNTIIVNPDAGATKRASYLADILQVDVGGFRKRRDLSKIVDGKAPILEHVYEGAVSIEGKNVIVVDDMIASGGSMIDTAKALKKMNANKVFIFTTFALFSDGKKSIDLFNDAYEKGYFDKVYSTNLTYVPEQIKESPWYHEVDCSNQLAQVINTLNLDESIEPLMNGKEKILKRVANIKKR